MNKYKKICEVIESNILAGRDKFIIYPFGELGMLTKNILNERYNIKEQYLIDNRLSQIREDVYPVAKLGEVSLNDTVILLVNDNEESYSEIRFQLMQYVKIDQFIDVFSTSMFWNKNVYYKEFIEINQPDINRINQLEIISREIYRNNVKGSIAECGVYQGKFANWISRFMPDRRFYLFDTFEGFDERDNCDKDTLVNHMPLQGVCHDTSVEFVLENIGYRANCIIRKGWFPETTTGLENEKFAFVHLDTDLYKPILAGLKFFWPRMNAGGYIMVHDGRHEGLAGVRDAVIEFSKENKVGYCISNDNGGTVIFSKPL